MYFIYYYLDHYVKNKIIYTSVLVCSLRYKDRLRIDSDAHYKIRSYEDSTATLVIEGVNVEDAGAYMCVAENDAGSTSSEARIRVQSKLCIRVC